MSDRRQSKKPKPKSVSVPVRMSAELENAIETAAGKVKLSKQDTMRLAIERGLDVLVAQLTTVNAA
jgi:hypothetical protein